MIKTTVRTLAAAALALLPLTATTITPAHAAETLSLHDAIEGLPLAAESREGYERTKFRHWIDEDRDGCNTRAEVLLAEAVTQPSVGAGCKLTGGTWFSYYDNTEVQGPSGLDIDHMVPLAESLGQRRLRLDRRATPGLRQRPRRRTVSGGGHGEEQPVQVRDKDPAAWLPPAGAARCTYGATGAARAAAGA